MQQWRQAAVAMAEQRQSELAGKSEEEILAAIDALLSLPHDMPDVPDQEVTSGLVEQQKIFHKNRK